MPMDTKLLEVVKPLLVAVVTAGRGCGLQ